MNPLVEQSISGVKHKRSIEDVCSIARNKSWTAKEDGHDVSQCIELPPEMRPIGLKEGGFVFGLKYILAKGSLFF